MSVDYESSIKKECYRLMGYLKAETAEAKNLMAKFRHAASMCPGEDPILWGWLVSHIPSEMQGYESDISYAEYALYITLSMYAIGPPNTNERTIAVVAAQTEISRKKIVAVETASGMEDLQNALRGLVKLVLSKGCTFDYGQLAEDLYSWQFDKTKVARKWEREYAQKVHA